MKMVGRPKATNSKVIAQLQTPEYDARLPEL